MFFTDVDVIHLINFLSLLVFACIDENLTYREGFFDDIKAFMK